MRVIGIDGKQLGVMPRAQALSMAQELNTDLVEVAPQADPPVCRLMDFGKFQYERAKKEREARKMQKEVEIKEIRLRPKTGEHDIAVVLRRARKFLVVYLDGAGEVADKYVALQAKGEGDGFQPRFEALLDEMEKVSAEQHAKLLENDSFDLDVQLQVLSDRLKKEGVA